MSNADAQAYSEPQIGARDEGERFWEKGIQIPWGTSEWHKEWLQCLQDEKQALSVAFKKAMQAAQNGASSTQLTGNDDDVAAYLQKFSRQKAVSILKEI